jgi:hypothetical protein
MVPLRLIPLTINRRREVIEQDVIFGRVYRLQNQLREEMLNCTPEQMRRLQRTHEVASILGDFMRISSVTCEEVSHAATLLLEREYSHTEELYQLRERVTVLETQQRRMTIALCFTGVAILGLVGANFFTAPAVKQCNIFSSTTVNR